MPTRPIRLAIVDDHQFVTDALALTIKSVPARFELIGVANRLADLPQLLRLTAADVALVDFRLPDGFGSQAIRRITDEWPRTKSLLFSGNASIDIIDEAVAAGADGFVDKTGSMKELLDKVERAYRGEILLSPEVLQQLFLRSQRGGSLRHDVDLTERERTVLTALLETGSLEASAARIGISPATARGHVANAMAKLGAKSRMEAVSMALRYGLIRPEVLV